MNTKEFVQVLRKIIKEEVKSAVTEAMRDISINNLVESVTNTPDISAIEKNYTPVKQKIKKPEPKAFTKDPLLNSLLNETAQSGAHIPIEHNDFSEWPSMDFKTDYSGVMGRPKFAQPQNTKIDATPDGINPNIVPEEIKSVLTRDYRSLMKAMDKKKNK